MNRRAAIIGNKNLSIKKVIQHHEKIQQRHVVKTNSTFYFIFFAQSQKPQGHKPTYSDPLKKREMYKKVIIDP